MSRGEVCIVIPCHNEAACIRGVLDSLRRSQPEASLVVVNDCSTDATGEVLAGESGITVLTLPVNLGIGGAVQTGLMYAARNGFRYAVKFDGDGQHPADLVDELLAPIREGRADLVIGSRFLGDVNGFKSTSMRRVGIRFFRCLNSALVGRRMTDNTSGFRAYSREALIFAEEHYPSFDYPEPEEVVLMSRNGFRILEIPTPMRERSGGVSSINFWKSAYFMVKVFFSVVVAALRPRIRKTEGAEE